MNNPAQQIEKNKPQRVLGTYPQRQEGLLMQRIRLMGGKINPAQWRSIVSIARRFTHNTPLHLTTRQDFELHNIAAADIESVYEQLRLAGFDTYGACGDCVRNLTICPGCEFHKDAIDVRPLAQKVHQVLFANPVSLNLPRKFKISFSGCSNACARPFINDLGFIANPDGSFRAVGAGSLGPRPGPGIELYPALSAAEVIGLSEAALELFAQMGDRENRRKARLRHVRQRLGDDEFRRQLEEKFQAGKQKHADTITCASVKKPRPYKIVLQCVTGRIPLEHAELLAEFCEQNHIAARINLTHGIELFADKSIELPSELKQYENLPCIVACPGSDTCGNGHTNCRKLAVQMTDCLRGIEYKDKVIAISGCPNHCAQSAVADIGLCGRTKTIDDRQQEVYQVYIHGGCGKNEKLAIQHDLAAVNEIPQTVKVLLKK